MKTHESFICSLSSSETVKSRYVHPSERLPPGREKQAIVKGKTVYEIRDQAHPFGQALRELSDSCDLVCSAPMTVLLAGEHAGVDGSFMLAAQLPLRVYIGMIGRNVSTSANPSPVLSSFRYYDPLYDIVEDRSHNPEYLGVEENLRNIGSLLRGIVKEQQWKFLPAEVVLLSEAPPGRGANWSGAFATAIALSLYLLQGEGIPTQLQPDNWKYRTQIPQRNEDIEKLFRVAMHIECLSHRFASGYGPACSLLPALGKLWVYKGCIDPKFAAASGDARRNPHFFLSHWDAYQQQLVTAERYNLTDIYDLLLVDSGRAKSTCDSVGRIRGLEEDQLAQDLVNLLTNDPNQPDDVLAKSPILFDQLLRTHRLGLSTLGTLSHLAIKMLRDCLGGIADPQTTLRIISSIDALLRQLGLSFAELDALRKSLTVPLQQHRLAVKFSGGGGGGDMLIWGSPEAIREVPLGERSDDERPTVVWQLSRDGLSHEGAMCHFPRDFQPFGKRASSLPAPRDPVPHHAIVISARGEVVRPSAVPSSLFDVYRVLRPFSLQGICLYMYSYEDASRDRFESLYLTWPVQNMTGTREVRASSFHPKEGCVLLKELFLAFARQGCLCLENPQPLLGPDGRLRSTAMIDLDLARGALNFEANRLERQEAPLEFPHLHVQRIADGQVRVSLKLPEHSHFFVISPARE